VVTSVVDSYGERKQTNQAEAEASLIAAGEKRGCCEMSNKGQIESAEAASDHMVFTAAETCCPRAKLQANPAAGNSDFCSLRNTNPPTDAGQRTPCFRARLVHRGVSNN